MMGYATTRTGFKIPPEWPATRKLKSVLVVHPAPFVSVTGSANSSPMLSRLTGQARARTIRGIRLRRALKYATMLKFGK